MRVFLIHGMGRTPASLWLLERRLEREGHRPSRFGYTVSLSSFDEIAEEFLDHVREVVTADDGGDYAIVGHSLGNIIARSVDPRLPPGFARSIMLAPPNQPAVLARLLKDNPIFRLATQDAGQSLGDDAFYAQLPKPSAPALIIAGTRGPRAPWLPFGGEKNDSVVRLQETFIEGVPVVEVPGVHTFLMNRRDVFSHIRDFLASGEEENNPPITSSV